MSRSKLRLVPILILAIAFLSPSAYSQIKDPGTPVERLDYCGSKINLKNASSERITQNKQMTQDIKQRTINRRLHIEGGGTITESAIVIPTVFHIVHATADVNPGMGSNVSDARVYAALAHMNSAFSNTLFNGVSTATNISFCLAGQDGMGNPSNGITRFPSDFFTNLDNQIHDLPGAPGPNSMKNVTADPATWPREDYMNVWIVESITRNGNPNVAGYATFPGSHGLWNDGIVLESQFFGNSAANDRVLIHEAGHYLNLLHTFGSGDETTLDCANNDCLLENDHVCDTAPDRQGFTCDPGTNSCSTDADDTSANNPFTTDVDDPLLNYMDYGNLACEEVFTAGQSVRMRLTLIDDLTGEELVRGSLLNSQGCCTPTVAANFTFTSIGLDVNFDASTSTGGISDYVWDFGDGSLLTTQTPTTAHTYIAPGMQQVTLTVIPSDGSGCVSTFTLSFDLCTGNLAEDFTFTVNGNDVTFNAVANPDGYFWDFGDGNFSSLQNPTHTYAGPDLYMVCLRTGLVTDPCNIPTCEGVNIGICDPVSDCDEHICNGDVENYFQNSNYYGQTANTIVWTNGTDIDRGSVDILYDIANQNNIIGYGNFHQVGSTAETLTIPLNPPVGDGCTIDVSFDAGVEFPAQTLRIFGFGGVPCNPVNFDASCNIGSLNTLCPGFTSFCIQEIPGSQLTTGIPGYQTLVFGDPDYPYTQDLGVVYATDLPQPLTNTSFSWTNNTGTTMDFMVIYINIDPAEDETQTAFLDNLSLVSECPGPEFTFTENCGTVTFDAINESPGNTHLWNFGDGNESTDADPIHTYTANDVYTVSHTLFTPCGPETETQSVTINVDIPDPRFVIVDQNCGTICFESNDQNPDATHLWDFGDMVGTSALFNPCYTFAAEGVYTVSHTVTNSCGTGTETLEVTIDFGNSIDPAFTTVINCGEVTFVPSDLDPSMTHSWEFGTGDDSDEISPVYTYTVADTYAVTHTVVNDCGVEVSITQDVVIDLSGCGGCDCPPGNNSYDIGQDGTTTLLSQSGLPPASVFNTNGCISISGRLEIDSDYLIFGGEIIMNPGAEIYVNTGWILNISFADNIHGCTEMWKGITVPDDAGLIFRNNTISDAQYAIQLEHNSTLECVDNVFDRNHVGIYVPFVDFLYQTILLTEPLDGNSFDCTGALLPAFSGQSPYLDRSYAGIELHACIFTIGSESVSTSNTFNSLRNGIIAQDCIVNIYDVEIADMVGSVGTSGGGTAIPYWGGAGIGCYFENTEVVMRKNFIRDSDRGVFAIHSSLDLLSCEIQNAYVAVLIREPDNRIINLKSNTFNYERFGNYFLWPDNAEKIRVTEQNTFEPNLLVDPSSPGTSNIGVFISGKGSSANFWIADKPKVVSNNSFLLNSQAAGIMVSNDNNWGINFNSIERVSTDNYGFGLSNSLTFINASFNQIYGNDAMNVPGGTAINSDVDGITFSASKNNIICCNTVENVNLGVGFLGACNDTQLRHTTTGNTAGRGLQCNSSTVLSDQFDHYGNQWTGVNGTQSTGVHWGTAAEVEDSQFRVQGTPGSSSYFPDDMIAANGDWFISHPGTAQSCVADCQTPMMNPPLVPPTTEKPDCADVELKAADVSAANRGYADSYFADMLNFETSRYLFNKLSKYPCLTGENKITDVFYQNNKDKLLGNIYNFSNGLEMAMVNDPKDALAAFDLYIDGKDLMKDLMDVESQIQKTSDPREVELLLVQKLNTLNAISANGSLRADILTHMLDRQRQSILGLRALNSKIDPEDAISSDIKIVNQHAVDILGNGQNDLTKDQISALETIAKKCPMRDGEVVFSARSLLSLEEAFEGEQYNCYPIQKQSPNQRLAENEEASNLEQIFKVHPNPSSGTVNVAINGSQSGVLRLTTLSGQILFDQEIETLNLEEDHYALQFNNLTQGIYLLTLETKDGNRFHEKIIILNQD